MNLTRKRNNWFLGNNGHLTWLGIYLILAVVTIACFIFHYPKLIGLRTLFLDPAAGLKVDYLISKGLIPEVDFALNYGLFPLIIGHIWYEIFGRTPQAFNGLQLFFNLLTMLVLARIISFADLKPIGILLIAVTIPFSFLYMDGNNLCHVMEPFFICLALSEQLAGRKQYALVALIFGWFTKPSMSIVYIFFLLLTYLFDLYRKKITIRDLIYQLRLPFLAFIVLIVLVGINFGMTPIVSSLIPLRSAQDYKDAGFHGFFSDTGRSFWGPSGAKITYYLGTSAGLWISLTVLLILFVLYTFYKKITETASERTNQLSGFALTLLCLHLSFVFFFYGSTRSWRLYSYIITIGGSLWASRKLQGLTKLRLFLLSIVTVLAIFSYHLDFKDSFSAWKIFKPQSSLVGLWLDKNGIKELTDLISSCKVENTLIYAPGSLDLFFPSCHMPESFYPLTNANLNDRDLARINKQFDEAQQVVVLGDTYDNGITYIPKLKQKFAKFEFDHKDKMFTYLRRKN